MPGNWQRCTCSVDRSSYFVKYHRDKGLLILECCKCERRSVFSDFDKVVRLDDKLRLVRVHEMLEKEEPWILETQNMKRDQKENIRIDILNDLKKNPKGLQYTELLQHIGCRPTTLSAGLSHMKRRNLVYREPEFGRWRYTGIEYKIIKNKLKVSFAPRPGKTLLKLEGK